MNKGMLTFISSAARLAGTASLALLASYAVGCVDQPGDERLGEGQSDLVFWNTAYFHSTTDLGGAALIAGYPNCALSGIQGNFSKGESPQWDVESLFSEAGVHNSVLEAHGGAYTNNNNDRVWANNSVGAKADCWDNSSATFVAGASWGGISANYSPAKIAPLGGGNRQCFLSHLQAADNTYNSASTYVQVKKYTTTNSTHPTTGWYIEGNLNLASGASGWPVTGALCFDFPTAQEFGTYNISSSPGQFATQATYANYTAGCALTRIQGPFTNNSLSTGVWVEPDPSTGMWTLHAYGGQAGTAVCID